MRQLFVFALLLMIMSSILAQDTSEIISNNRKKIHQRFSFTAESYSKLLGLQYQVGFRRSFAGFFYQHSPDLFQGEMETLSEIPYLVNDSMLFYKYEYRKETKCAYGLNFESNFRLKRDRSQFTIGFSVYSGCYAFREWNADLYYRFYTDSLGNIYYHDQYDDPSFNPDDAFLFTLGYSESKNTYRLLGIDPYAGFRGEIKNGFSLGVYVKEKFIHYKIKDRYFFDPSSRLEQPLDEYGKRYFSFMIVLSYHINYKET